MSDESRLAVLETKVDGLLDKYDGVISELKKLVERHDKDIYDTPGLKADIRNLNQAEIDRKKMISLIQAAIVAAVLEPVLLGVMWWMAYGNKMMTALKGAQTP